MFDKWGFCSDIGGKFCVSHNNSEQGYTLFRSLLYNVEFSNKISRNVRLVDFSIINFILENHCRIINFLDVSMLVSNSTKNKVMFNFDDRITDLIIYNIKDNTFFTGSEWQHKSMCINHMAQSTTIKTYYSLFSGDTCTFDAKSANILNEILPTTIEKLYLRDCHNYNVFLREKLNTLNLTHLYLDNWNYFCKNIKLPATLIHLNITTSKDFCDVDNLTKLETFICTHFTIEYINKLPENVYEISLGNVMGVNETDQYNITFPPQLRKLTIAGKDSEKMCDNLPKTITNLTLCGVFNNPVNNLPDSITHLTLSGLFNQSVEFLPASITHLCFSQFNGPIRIHKIPQTESMQFLRGGQQQQIPQFEENFNQPVADILPKSLEYVIFGRDFNQDISKLPDSIKYLKLGTEFDHPITKLPKSLAKLCLYKHNQNIMVDEGLQYYLHLVEYYD